MVSVLSFPRGGSRNPTDTNPLRASVVADNNDQQDKELDQVMLPMDNTSPIDMLLAHVSPSQDSTCQQRKIDKQHVR